jgi:hypothetical protein
LGDYWRLLWELAASCPVPYISNDALPEKLILAEQTKLEGYNFKVIVDGIELYKPVSLKDNPGGYTIEKIEPVQKKVYGKDVSFHGYIIVQEGAQLKPDELRGIMIRIKSIGIGYYDPSMLDYRINEGPRSRWLTGEIYVDDGLEDALNIDRDSFNRFHPEFRAVQEYIHQILQEVIFPKVYEQIEVRTKKREKVKEKERTDHLQRTISETLDKRVTIRHQPKTSADDRQPRVGVVQKSNSVEVHLPKNDKSGAKKSKRQLATAILAIYEVAAAEKTRDKQKEIFTKLLFDLIEKW